MTTFTLAPVAAAIAAACLAMPAAAQTFPPQHWLSDNGIITVQPNGQHDWTAEQLGDVRAIEEAFYRWAYFYDEGRSDLLPSLLTEDVEVVVLLGSAEPLATFTGVAAVAEYNDSTMAAQMDQRRHVISNVLVDNLDESSASANAFGLVIGAADGLSLGAMVVYDADLTRGADGIWRFARLVIAIDDYAGNLSGD